MRSPGFTLIELLVVLAIIAIAGSIALSQTTADKRMGEVGAAANELAATLRSARALAMQRQAIHAVSFHLQNGVGTSGRLLNNWDGEHWYRIIGPSLESNRPAPPNPAALSNDANVAKIVRGVPRAWIGDQHRLPARKVRFLALTDQDNGHAHTWSGPTDRFARFPDSYPRPWCGWWDAGTGRLYPWGGYDTLLRDADSRANSGFYYQGNDGTITGCRSPATRTSTLTAADLGTSVTSGGNTVLLVQNAPRPLVNGNWLDFQVVFQPDGQVVVPGFMELRYNSRLRSGGTGGNAVPGWGDLGDLYPTWRDFWSHKPDERPATSFQARSGYWWMTLAPDMQADSDVFPNAQAAVRSMQPCFRVGISGVGDVRVALMGNTPSGTLDGSITDWGSRAQTRVKYAGNLLTETPGQPRGRPVTDVITPEMLTRRSWWYAP